MSRKFHLITTLFFSIFIIGGFGVAVAQTNGHVRLDLHGTPFPQSLNWSGKAISLEANARSCDPEQQKLVTKMFTMTADLIKLEDDQKALSSKVTKMSETDPDSNLESSIKPAPHGSYAIVMSDIYSKIPLATLLPAIYACTTMSYGSAEEARALDLYVPTTNQVVPVYSPALGFYRIL